MRLPAQPQQIPGLWLALVLAVAGVEAARGAESPAPTRWQHPSAWYPRSVGRWFADLPAPLRYSEVRYREGDDPRWARPDWDDRAWAIRGFWDLPARAGIHWVRFRVRMGDAADQRLPAGVMISTVVAYEVFWDGALLGNSGTPGDRREAEVPGRVDSWFSVPAALLGPGEHLVAVRISSYRCGFPAPTSGFRFLVDAPSFLQRLVVREALAPTVAAGAVLMIALASLILWLLAARQPTLLWLAGMGFCAGAMQGLHCIRWFFQYPADWHFPVLVTMTWLVGAQGVCLVALVIVHFDVPARRWLLAAVIVAFGLVAWLSPQRMNLEGVNILRVAIFVALACAGWAAWQRRRGAWPVVAGVLVSAALLAVEAEDYRSSFFVKFLPAMLGLIVSLALHLHDARRRAQTAQLAATRLELELLKKNIQPHFLLNTLATIVEMIEQTPRSAVTLIEALANEFRILARVSGEKLIPLGQELELCRAHLAIMSRRKAVHCTLAVCGADERLLVPPAMFHTLIENGLTHLGARAGELRFELSVRREPAVVRYRLIAHGDPWQDSVKPEPAREGTGTRYIKARLEESFTGCWRLGAGPIAGGWQTEIEIRPAGLAATADATVVPLQPPRAAAAAAK